MMRVPMLLLTVVLSGCELFDEGMQKSVELQDEPATTREEEILREFFDGDFAQKKVAHLIQYDLTNFDAVMNPRPKIDDVLDKYGRADGVTEKDLSPHGVRQMGTVYQYGRLGLVTQPGMNEIFWVIIN